MTSAFGEFGDCYAADRCVADERCQLFAGCRRDRVLLPCDPCQQNQRAEVPAVAWFHCNGGAILLLCQSHLDSYLDQCDEDERLEPSAVRWLDGSRTLAGAA